jgi:tetratricopeptide (TPR) repeat protein
VPEDLKKNKKKKSLAAQREELRSLAKPDPDAAPRPAIDMKKIGIRVGLLVVGLWAAAAAIWSYTRSWIPFAIVGLVSIAVVVAGVWFVRLVAKQKDIGAILQGADTEEGRKEALRRLATDYKKDDTQAVLAKAQLEMQEEPKKALETLEAIDLSKQMEPVADQVRSMRAMIHLTLGDVKEARTLVDAMKMGKQDDVKTRAMFASVAAEAWGRTGQGKKALELLELFNADEPELGEIKVQIWRARAFAYAGVSDMKGAGRALRKLAEMNPQLLGMFLTTKRVHPMLAQEAKQLLMRSGAVKPKMVQKRM